MAIVAPVLLVTAAVLVLAAVDIATFLRAAARIEQPASVVDRRRGVRTRFRWWAVVVAAAMAIATAWSINVYAPLRASGPVAGGGPLFLGYTPASYGGRDDYNFAYVPGGEFRYAFELVNDGDVPLTVTGLGDEGRWAFGIQVNAVFDRASLTFPISGTGTTVDAYEPFHPIQLQPHSRVRVALVLGVRQCSGVTAAATLAPGETPGRSFVGRGSGKATFGSVKMTWSALGVGRVTDVELPAGLAVSVPNAYGCDSPGASPPAASSPPSEPASP